MRIKFHTLWCVSLLLWALLARAAVQQHINSFGKWTTVKWLVGADENQPVDLKVRALYVDARLKELHHRGIARRNRSALCCATGVPPERQFARRGCSSLAVAAEWMAAG